MAINGVALAYGTFGGLIFYAGIRGATISDTIKSATTGSLNVPQTQPIPTPSDYESTEGNNGSSGSSASGDTSGSAEQNYLTIGNYLMQNGYSAAGAAGVVGCIAGESAGNPEANSGSGIGLIQWTGSNKSMVPALTGNATKDLQAQLPAIITYNNAQGAELVKMLNAMTNPVQAADFYSQYFERPAVTDSDVRASVATSVYNQLTAKNQSGGSAPGSGGTRIVGN